MDRTLTQRAQRTLGLVLGWHRVAEVERAVQLVRSSSRRRHPIVLCGDYDLSWIAGLLHRRLLDASRPFATLYPKNEDGRDLSAAVANYRTVDDALLAVSGGTVCVCLRRTPAPTLRELLAARTHTQIVVCARPRDIDVLTAYNAIEVPPLARRADDDIERVVDEFAAEALDELRARPSSYTATMRAWLARHAARDLPTLEFATRRLVALRDGVSITSTAKRLGVSHVALSRWLGRRRTSDVRAALGGVDVINVRTSH
jgi:hypothetical protein